MPLIFASNEETESGLSYDDRTGISYEFPKMYQRLILPGTRFVYYRGRRKVGGGRQPQVYFGSGLVGQVSVSVENPRRLRCEILDYTPFPTPIPFKSPDGIHLEPDGARKGYFERGVRPVDDDTFERILSLGLGQSAPPAGGPTNGSGVGPSYASPETAAAVDEYSMRVALAHVQSQYPEAKIVRQPHNNPGFDIRVETTDGGTRYVEVKGTQSALPNFLLSEGERRFSLDHRDEFCLVVVSCIDLVVGTHEIRTHHGPIHRDLFELRPSQWKGRFPVSGPQTTSCDEDVD